MASLRGILRRLFGNAGHLLRRIASRGLLPKPGGVWLDVPLGRDTAEQRLPPVPFSRSHGLSLFDTLRCLEAAAEDGRVVGVVLRFSGRLPGWSKALALRRAVERMREAGKRVVAWGESFGAEEYLVASGANRVWLPESGTLFLVGLRVEQYFLRGLLERLDVEPEVIRIGGYKTAAEILTRESMSEEQREQLESWLEDLFSELVAGIARGRGLDAGQVRERIDSGPFPAPKAVDNGLIDACLYPDEIPLAIESLTPLSTGGHAGPRRAHLVGAESYFRLVASDPGWRPLWRDLPRIAYVVASGSIQRGAGLRGITSTGLGELLEGLAREPGVRGVVLRLDSPGGDGVASDLLFRAVRRLGREKPVVVSMGDVAASGGYYLAAAADAIYAEVATLTGSIGIVWGKLNLERFYRRLGVAKAGVERGARSGLLSEARGFTADEKTAVKDGMQALYETFLARVAEGRRLSVESVSRVAEGRIWSGLQARTAGLVDAIGGPVEALREVCRRAGFRTGERFALEVHPRRPRLGLGALFGAVRWALRSAGIGTRSR